MTPELFVIPALATCAIVLICGGIEGSLTRLVAFAAALRWGYIEFRAMYRATKAHYGVVDKVAPAERSERNLQLHRQLR